jgi:hypothetical protein
MSDGTGPTTSNAGQATGIPDESDLPAMQGLDDDDLSDPAAAEDAAEPDAPNVSQESGTDPKGPSDPMPDMSGTSGG